MDCPKCNGETESEVQHSYFKAGEVNDVSRCLDCGFEFYEVYRKQGKWKPWYENVRVFERYTNDMETPTEEISQTMEPLREEPIMSQTIEGYAEHMEPLRKKTEYRLPHYSSTSVVYPSWYRESY